MRFLLDTQIFIRFAVEPAALRPGAHSLIVDAANTPCLSHISLFEIIIKQKIGKLAQFDIPIPTMIALAEAHGFTILPITAAHIAAYDRIPLLPNHRDPFDRLLLATALAEGVPILSSDALFPQYAPLVDVVPG